MSKFNYNSDLCQQISELDEKLVTVILLVKKLETRIATLEKLATAKGLMKKKNNNINKVEDDACTLM